MIVVLSLILKWSKIKWQLITYNLLAGNYPRDNVSCKNENNAERGRSVNNFCFQHNWKLLRFWFRTRMRAYKKSRLSWNRHSRLNCLFSQTTEKISSVGQSCKLTVRTIKWPKGCLLFNILNHYSLWNSSEYYWNIFKSHECETSNDFNCWSHRIEVCLSRTWKDLKIQNSFVQLRSEWATSWKWCMFKHTNRQFCFRIVIKWQGLRYSRECWCS